MERRSTAGSAACEGSCRRGVGERTPSPRKSGSGRPAVHPFAALSADSMERASAGEGGSPSPPAAALLFVPLKSALPSGAALPSPPPPGTSRGLLCCCRCPAWAPRPALLKRGDALRARARARCLPKEPPPPAQQPASPPRSYRVPRMATATEKGGGLKTKGKFQRRETSRSGHGNSSPKLRTEPVPSSSRGGALSTSHGKQEDHLLPRKCAWERVGHGNG